MRHALGHLILCAVWAGLLAGCGSSVYYAAMEKAGYHKRDLLVEEVEDTRESQEEVKEQFQSALEKFMSVVEVDGGELQARYEGLKAELEASEAKARQLGGHIDEVEDVATALFTEWEAELDEYSQARLRAASADKLRRTRQRYHRLITAMRRAEARIEPVLVVFRDQVLFLKHNLNAKAVASLQNELVTVETDVASLIKAMEVSIAEADAFIQGMGE